MAGYTLAGGVSISNVNMKVDYTLKTSPEHSVSLLNNELISGQAFDYNLGFLAVGYPEDDKVEIFKEQNNSFILINTFYGVAGSEFGKSISMNSGKLAVGAPKLNGNGGVYWYEYNLGEWITGNVPIIRAYDEVTENNSDYGSKIIVGEDIIIVSAPNAFGSGNTLRSGAVYVYRYLPVEKIAVLQRKIIAPITQNGLRFGHDISLSNENSILISSPNETVSSIPNVGVVRQYRRQTPGNNWSLNFTHNAPLPVPDGKFGSTIYHNYGIKIISTERGKVFTYKGFGDSWSLLGELSSGSGPMSDIPDSIMGKLIDMEPSRQMLFLVSNSDQLKILELVQGEWMTVDTIVAGPTGLVVEDTKFITGSNSVKSLWLINDLEI